MAEMNEQKYTENKMQEIARYVEKQLLPGWGFVVLAFQFGNAKGRMNYVSNAERESVVKAMKEFIGKTDGHWAEQQ